MPYIDLDYTRFHYQQRGEGPDLVLIHAATSNMAVWMFSGIIEALSDEFRVTAYDLRGHGMSDRTATGYTSHDMACDLKNLCTAFGIHSAYLVGHSFGGCIAMHAAVLYPEIVKGVVVSDTYFPGLAHLEPRLNQIPIWKKWCELLGSVGADIGDVVDFQKLFCAVSELAPEQIEALEMTLDPFSMRWLGELANLSSTSCGSDIFSEAGLTSEKICSIQKPVIALYDEHTAFQATQKYLKEHLPRCIIENVPAANHLAPLENPTAFISLVRKYLCLS